MDEELSRERQPLLTRLNLLAGQMDDQTLQLFAKLGEVLVEGKKGDEIGEITSSITYNI